MDEQKPTPRRTSPLERYAADHGIDLESAEARIMGDVVAVLLDPRYQQKPADEGKAQADPPDAV